MFKNALKEIIIILLIIIALILILGLLLYKYIPTNKIIPEEISYVTPENIKEELSKKEMAESSEPLITKQLTASDINNYKRIDSFVPGKVNPFSSYKNEEDVENENTTNNSTSGTQTNQGNGTTTIPNNNSTSNNTSEGRYLPNRGTK